MRIHLLACVAFLAAPLALSAQANKKAAANRLAYLDEFDPYYPSHTFPKLITPQWVGEPGVDAVVILGIDDMRDPKRYEAFLRPILRRLQEIDGRAPVSIMTCSMDPKEQQLQTWLKEGLSLECHTFDHPCPFFKKGFADAKGTYEKCVDLMHQVPNSTPVAFRMPCCDSMNTPSPRFWAEIFNKVTPPTAKDGPQGTKGGNFLTLDTSVFSVYTSADPELPKALVLDKNGQERFTPYLPRDRSFVNTIENYPYPYIIGRMCWEFPCMVPSDWEANHRHKPNNPQTVEDWKAALDCTVLKKGVFCLVFHPHGWIRNDQVVELIDHAVQKHGKKVKFLTFKEAEERLRNNLQEGQPLRVTPTRDRPFAGDNGVRLLDLNGDGYQDVVIGNGARRQTSIWDPATAKWELAKFPEYLDSGDHRHRQVGDDNDWHFGIWEPDGLPSLFGINPSAKEWHFDGEKWVARTALEKVLDKKPAPETKAEKFDFFAGFEPWQHDRGIRFRDLDGDGICEAIVSNPARQAVFQWSARDKAWKPLSFAMPRGAYFVNKKGDGGTVLVDLNKDGKLDVVFANEEDYGVYLFTDMKTGWSKKVMAGKRADKDALPMIARHGANNGFWVHSRHFWWSNEDTVLLKDHVDRRSIEELLAK